MSSKIIFAMLVLVFPGSVLGQLENPNQYALNQPGILIITSAQDSTAGFQWQVGPGAGRISLVWNGGVLSVPDTLAMEGYPNNNLGIPLLAGFSGNGDKGAVVFDDGTYPVLENLILSDGVVQLVVSSGELEIHGPRFRYTGPQPISDDSKSNYLLIAGLLLLIGVLLRRARMILRKRA